MKINLKPSPLLISLMCLLGGAVGVNRVAAAPPVKSAGPLGLGIVLGDPTGLSGKYWTGSEKAFDMGLAFSFGDYFLAYGDYLFHFPGAFGGSSEFIRDLTPYIGIGGFIGFSTDDRYRRDRHSIFKDTHSSVGLGLRIPLGVEWVATGAPIGVFMEIVPGMSLVPNTDGLLQAGIGARYYF